MQARLGKRILYLEKFNDYGIDNIIDGEVGDTDDNYNADPNHDNYHYIDNIYGLDTNGIWDFEDFGEDGCSDELGPFPGCFPRKLH